MQEHLFTNTSNECIETSNNDMRVTSIFLNFKAPHKNSIEYDKEDFNKIDIISKQKQKKEKLTFSVVKNTKVNKDSVDTARSSFQFKNKILNDEIFSKLKHSYNPESKELHYYPIHKENSSSSTVYFNTNPTINLDKLINNIEKTNNKLFSFNYNNKLTKHNHGRKASSIHIDDYKSLPSLYKVKSFAADEYYTLSYTSPTEFDFSKPSNKKQQLNFFYKRSSCKDISQMQQNFKDDSKRIVMLNQKNKQMIEMNNKIQLKKKEALKEKAINIKGGVINQAGFNKKKYFKLENYMKYNLYAKDEQENNENLALISKLKYNLEQKISVLPKMDLTQVKSSEKENINIERCIKDFFPNLQSKINIINKY